MLKNLNFCERYSYNILNMNENVILKHESTQDLIKK
jgi:hypothetical protein